MRHAWVSRVGIITLVGGFCLVGYGLGGTPAAAVPPVIEDALAGVTQNWDKNLPSASRFTVLSAFGGAAVRDNNTGLVWEQAPDPTPPIGWAGATNYCINKTVGGTVGWRLPSVIELKSVQDPSLPVPFVPATVFTGIDNLMFFWSASSFAPDLTLAWAVSFGSIADVNRGAKVQSFRAWCVRGPMNADAY
jgi:uncharacterized protein DUF1566